MKFLRWLFHDILGWHNGDGTIGYFDGVNRVSICSICGEKVLQDSQGNWFLASQGK